MADQPDIVERLRAHAEHGDDCDDHSSVLLHQAADEIERLRGELAYSDQRQQTLREELERLRKEPEKLNRLRLPKKLREWLPDGKPPT
jgi:septal ring factor EnvC (AmiA/AmiB activator)